MDWPAGLVIHRNGKSYIKLFELDAVDSLQILREHWMTGLDKQIIVRGEGEDGSAIVCCKSYLLRISRYFRPFVARWNNDQADSVSEIKLENILLEVFKNLLELASTGLLEIGGHSDLSTLVGAANFLAMADLSDRLSKLIRDEIENENNSVILWCFMTSEEYHGYVGLSGEVSGLVRARFEYILATCSEQLMDLSGKQWLDIVSDPALFVVSEDVLFRTLCRWVAVDNSKRSDDFIAMAKYIRGGCLSENLLAEFRNGSSVPSVVRMFIACINASSESQQRTVEVVAFFPWGKDGRAVRGAELLCYDPFTRSEGSASLAIKLDAKSVLNRGGCVSPANVICLFRGHTEVTGDSILENWIPEVAHRIPYTYIELPNYCAAAHLDGFVYMTLLNIRHLERGFFKFDCTDQICSNVSKIRNVPVDLINLWNLLLIGLAGNIHVLSDDCRYTYDPENEVWSDALPVTPNFAEFPQSYCIGPDGLAYITGFLENKLWIFNAATSELRLSAACPETIWRILNIEKKIVCVVFAGEAEELASCLYDHVRDVWTERQEIPMEMDELGDFVPVRLLASSFNLVPRKRTKRRLDD